MTFVPGSASDLPFRDGRFDQILCQAAFKNFVQPQRAVDEMYRVLRPGGLAIVQDLRKQASNEAIERAVEAMQLRPLRRFLTRRTLRGLRRRAHGPEEFVGFGRRSRFGGSTVSGDGIGLEVRFRRQVPPEEA
jgi:ubiquinone/menaquinone biosynthesis C-methylase UbiE